MRLQNFKSKLSFFVFILCGVFVTPLFSASAQECGIVYEEITKLKRPSFESYKVWYAEYGDQHTTERFKSAVPLKNGRFLAIGEQDNPFTNERQMVLVEVDDRGRVRSHKTENLESVEEVVDVILSGDGFVALVNLMPARQKQEMWVGLYDAQGKIKLSKTFNDKKYSIAGSDILLKNDETGFVVLENYFDAAQVGGDAFSQLLVLDMDGNVQAKRAMRPGMKNALSSIYRAADGLLFGVGSIERSSGLLTGWVAGMNADNQLSWQQSYSRGAQAQLYAVRSYDANNLLVAGEVKPANDGPSGAWVMMLNNYDGRVLWQRFYTADFDLSARDIYVHDDGQITLMVNASNANREKIEKDLDAQNSLIAPERFFQDHVKIIQLNRRGQMMALSEYFNGVGFNGEKLVLTKDDLRLIVGHSHVEYLPDRKYDLKSSLEAEPILSEDAVVVAVPSPDPYKDPCDVYK